MAELLEGIESFKNYRFCNLIVLLVIEFVPVEKANLFSRQLMATPIIPASLILKCLKCSSGHL